MKMKKTILTAVIAAMSLSSIAMAAPKPHKIPEPHKIEQQHKIAKQLQAHKKAHFKKVAHYKYQWHHGHWVPVHHHG